MGDIKGGVEYIAARHAIPPVRRSVHMTSGTISDNEYQADIIYNFTLFGLLVSPCVLVAGPIRVKSNTSMTHIHAWYTVLLGDSEYQAETICNITLFLLQYPVSACRAVI